MSLYRLQLKVNPGVWQQFFARRADPKFKSLRDKVLSRDHYACQFCGFQASQYQEVLNLDQNYANNKLDNLATACCFCSQCFFLESVGIGNYGGGVLVYLPEIGQAELNAMCHVMFCAIANGTSYKNTAEQIFRSLKFRSHSIEDYFGEGTSKPSVFGRLLLSSPAVEKTPVQDILHDLRLLPLQNRFKKEIDAWARAALDEIPVEE